jgi:hypothetical protein
VTFANRNLRLGARLCGCISPIDRLQRDDARGEVDDAATQTEHNRDPVVLAAELRPLLARNATGGAERDRCLSVENVEALQAANLFEVMMPHRRGG